MIAVYGSRSASSQGAIKLFHTHTSHQIKGLHEVVRHIIGAQRGVGYERSGYRLADLV